MASSEAHQETKWTDASIRWPDDKPVTDEDIEEEDAFMDPFKDPDPFQIFSFQFEINSQKNINLSIRGHKTDSDGVWESTGLTLWRAADYLCDYQVKNVEMFEGKRILELGAGLGLNGILAWRMTKNSSVIVTDGDTDALVLLRQNIERNRPAEKDAVERISCNQLIWGKESSSAFLEHHKGKLFDVLIASDIIYAECIIEPLWQTIQTLLCRKRGVFVMAFARRKVPVSREYVLESANRAGFQYELVREDTEEGIWIYLFRFQEGNE